MPTSADEHPDPSPAGSPAPESDWATQRREAAAERARMLRARADAEHARAARIVSLFVQVAREQGLEARPLAVQGYGGGTARTPLKGWYLRGDRTVAIDVDGHFYVLTTSLSMRQRLLGTMPVAEPVPMTIGEGGRDGDIVPLRFALERLLPGWETLSPEPLA
ncbi:MULTISPECIES: hypothetical protein [Actinomyces]|uniref:Uncharacterized protein n=1 Tax=Actinomyces respiraculi TaxID=2744574 RepID=A0A7T0LLX5_9ACTO|nr:MULTISPECIES: hypothetical protein [Actinomyces]QPL05982.1 hypothetical protein ID810_03250 [Actinomyces respiraculi]